VLTYYYAPTVLFQARLVIDNERIAGSSRSSPGKVVSRGGFPDEG
jgi:hypothetical protein